MFYKIRNREPLTHSGVFTLDEIKGNKKNVKTTYVTTREKKLRKLKDIWNIVKYAEVNLKNNWVSVAGFVVSGLYYDSFLELIGETEDSIQGKIYFIKER